MKRTIGLALFCLLLLSPTHCVAMTIRYALIVGNNNGMDTDGTRPFAPLDHAEREARQLKQTLVNYSNFDDSSRRTKLMLGATKKEIKAALSKLVRQKKIDEQTFGQIDSMFLFFFTGHGLEGRVLLRDGVLEAHEIGALFTDFDADFSVGVFDACFAGSLDTVALSSKGIHSAPGLNLFRELPEEVLSAEGRIWYVSSSRQQESYEDKQLGGVFTHFFIEGIVQAPTDGPGITLDSIWRYAQSKTVEYTSLRKRMQVPEQFINRFRSSTPVYFSFPHRRTATLVLSEHLEGRFALTYANGSLTEVFEKKRGDKQTLALYPGNARLLLVDGKRTIKTRSITLKPKTALLLSTMQEKPVEASVGQRSEPLFEKGFSNENNIMAIHVEPGASVLGGVGYGFNWSNERMLYARHSLAIPIRLDIKNGLINIRFHYGIDRREFPAWRHVVHELGGSLALGWGFDIKHFRLSAAGCYQLMFMSQRFADGEKRFGLRHKPSVVLAALFPRTGALQAEVFAELGPLFAPSTGNINQYYWHLSTTIGIQGYFRLY